MKTYEIWSNNGSVMLIDSALSKPLPNGHIRLAKIEANDVMEATKKMYEIVKINTQSRW
jgi:hypothetical protein